MLLREQVVKAELLIRCSLLVITSEFIVDVIVCCVKCYRLNKSQ